MWSVGLTCLTILGIYWILSQQIVNYFSHNNSTKLHGEVGLHVLLSHSESILEKDVLENQSALAKKNLFINRSTSLTNNKAATAYGN